jgi:L-ascorbate metabolism protein UlaG (beta-lactamase superfamily)
MDEQDARGPAVGAAWGVDRWRAPGAPAPEPVAGRITWLGHSTTTIDLGGVRVVTDPVTRARVAHLRRAGQVPPSALSQVDLVLVSHVHRDHLDLPSLEQIGRDVTVVVPAGAGPLIARQGFRDVVEVEAGDVHEHRGVAVRATHAEHSGSRGPLGLNAPALGYLLERPRRIYFAGDTDLFPEMRDISGELEVALIPISGWGPRLPPGHLDPESAARALQLLRPRVAIPIHWGTYWPMPRRSAPVRPAGEFVRQAARLAPEVEVRVLPVGGSCGI